MNEVRSKIRGWITLAIALVADLVMTVFMVIAAASVGGEKLIVPMSLSAVFYTIYASGFIAVGGLVYFFRTYRSTGFSRQRRHTQI